MDRIIAKGWASDHPPVIGATLMSEHALIEKIQRLSDGRVEEVEDFVDFLLERDAGATKSATRLAEASFERVWDNPEDAVYDDL